MKVTELYSKINELLENSQIKDSVGRYYTKVAFSEDLVGIPNADLKNVNAWAALFQQLDITNITAEEFITIHNNRKSNIIRFDKFTSDYCDFASHITWKLAMPHINEDGRVAYYADTNNINKKITLSKVGRVMQKVLPHIGFDLDAVADWYRVVSGEIPLEFAENDDPDLWEEVYRSPKIKSCMNNGNYGVTNYDTYRCYCTRAYGLPDNGLRLAYVGNPAYARAIVHEPSKTFVTSYGDSVLQEMLVNAGYTESHGYPDGTILWACDEDEPLAPYVDGNLSRASLTTKDGDEPYWTLIQDGDYSLQETTGVITLSKCACCGSYACSFDYDLTLYTYNTRREEVEEVGLICEDCYDSTDIRNVYHGGDLYLMDVSETAGLIEYDGDYYTNDSYTLDYHDLVYSTYNEEYHHISDVTYIEYLSDYVPDDCVRYCDHLGHDVCEDDARYNNLLGEWVSTLTDTHETTLINGQYFPDSYITDCEVTGLYIAADASDENLLKGLLELQGYTLDEYCQKLADETETSDE